VGQHDSKLVIRKSLRFSLSHSPTLPLSHCTYMARFSRNKIILISSLVILLIAAGGWLYSQRVKRIVIASYVPESALGYLEINERCGKQAGLCGQGRLAGEMERWK
jgi:hypothetical protein